MKKEILFASVVFFLGLLIFFIIEFQITGYVVKEQKKQVQFYFHEEVTKCPLDGYLFIGNKLIGKTERGFFNLTFENYRENFNDSELNVTVFGKLGECFKSNLFFEKSWKNPKIEDFYFEGESVFNFKTKIDSHNPSRKELIGFVQPENSINELANINLKKLNVFDDLSEINNYLNKKINYTKDWGFFKESYWQTPEETFERKKGDCEDFSTALLSLFLAYKPSLKCYNVIFLSHVTTFCYINENYIYYDQGKTELKKQASDKDSSEKVKEMLERLEKEYMEDYGINDSEEKAYFAFNNNEFIRFNNKEDFINWQYSLMNQESQENIFKKLEKNYMELKNQKENETAQEIEEISLATEKPEAVLLASKVSGNYLLLIISIISLSALFILIFMTVNRKK